MANLIEKKAYTIRKTILIAPELAFTIPAYISNQGIIADKKGRKILKAGTPLGCDTNFLMERNAELYIQDGADAKAVLLHDTDVTDSTVSASVIVSGYVDLSKLDEDVVELYTGTTIDALPKITFFNYEIEENVLGKKLYTFGALADIHLREDNYRGGIDDFNRAIPLLQNQGCEFVGVCGDLGYYSLEKELELYKTALNNLATVPFYICTGNHDMKYEESLWKQYTNCDFNFDFIYNNDAFIFLSLDKKSEITSTSATPYSSSIEWLKNTLDFYKDRRVFLFMHYAISNYSGLATGEYYGFSKDSTEDNEILELLQNNKNVIVFHAHTHYKFEVEEKYENINIYNFDDTKVSLVHIPSCCYPRDYDGTVLPDISQGYVIEVYEKGAVLKGIDLVSGEYMDKYTYTIETKNQKTDIVNDIVVSNTDVSLNAGKNKNISISLLKPQNVTVTAFVNNSNVTIDKTSLEFTEGNYNVPQTIKITAKDDISAEESSIITYKAKGSKDKTTSVTITKDEDEVLDYINVNQAYWDTGILPQDNMSMLLKVKLTKTSQYLAGSMISTSSTKRFDMQYTSSSVLQFALGAGKASSTIAGLNNDELVHTIKADAINKKLSLDGVVKGTCTSSFEQTDLSIYICEVHASTEDSTHKFIGEFHKFEIEEDGVLTHEYIPVKHNGEICLKDTKTNTYLYHSSGTVTEPNS